MEIKSPEMKSVLDDCLYQCCTKEMRKEQKKPYMSHGDFRESWKASNHGGARELGPVQKDPEFSVFNCP